MKDAMTEQEIMNFAHDFLNLLQAKNAHIGSLKHELSTANAALNIFSHMFDGGLLTVEDIRRAGRGVWIVTGIKGGIGGGCFAIPLKDNSGVITADKGIYRYEHYGSTWKAYTDKPYSTIEDITLNYDLFDIACARPLSEWSEDRDGNVLWWQFPIEEPPYVGTPNDCDFPNYHTHFTNIAIPVPFGNSAERRTRE